LVEVEKSEESIAPSPQSLELIQSRVVPSLEIGRQTTQRGDKNGVGLGDVETDVGDFIRH
jgi:hypothetical protein